MPTPKRIPELLLADDMLLAALDRGERHRRGDLQPGVSMITVKAHAGIEHNGATTRRLRPQLDRLTAEGLLQPLRRHSINMWTLTAAGRKRLAASRSKGKLQPLPESPQHRHWRENRHAAEHEIDQLLADAETLVAEAARVLAASPQPSSDVWVDLGQRLRNALQWIGSAIYCLREWQEPDETRADDAIHPLRDTPPWARFRTGPGQTSR